MSSCRTICSERPPPLSPDNDITGPGVITNYVASAGIAVFVILLYVMVAYDPGRDPFEKDEKSPEDPPFRPNAIDQLITRKVRGWSPWSISKCSKKRLEGSLIKCVVAMGDFQLITGFSILISGAVQLNCGLTVYEWQIIVYLAWFSCLTHLSCLMVLRSYLYAHTIGRTWRLIAMGVLAVMMIVGLLPTANYGNLFASRPRPSDYAVCYLRIRHSPGIALLSMIASALTIAIGFISRVMKLHKVISVTLWGRFRIQASHRSRDILRAVYKWCTASGPNLGLRFALVYRPLLAVFLVARFSLTEWFSMFVEAVWLFIAFFWGVLRLMSALNDNSNDQGDQDLWTKTAGQNKGDWSFGQVVSLVLLVAPLMGLLEYFDPDVAKGVEESSSREAFRPHEPLEHTPNFILPPFVEANPYTEDLNVDVFKDSETLGVTIVYSLLSVIVFVIELFFPSINKPLIEILFSVEWGIKVALAFTGTYGVVLFSLLIQSEMSIVRKKTRRTLQFLNIAFYVITFNIEVVSYGYAHPSAGKSQILLHCLQPFALGCYGLVSAMLRWAPSNEQIRSKA